MQQMTKLGREATKFFLEIIDMLGEKQSLKINNGGAGIMALDVEAIGESETPYGKGRLISFAHYYKQNGDLMRDPEITFLFVDNRHLISDEIKNNIKSGAIIGRYSKLDNLEMALIAVWPESYTQDNLGIYRKLITSINSKTVSFMPKAQADSAKFCTQWFRNIKQQQKL